jgi:distribution and morphology protein 10
MLEFMDYVQSAFYAASRWNVDNSYASLTTTTNNLLDFRTPHGVRLHILSPVRTSRQATSSVVRAW